MKWKLKLRLDSTKATHTSDILTKILQQNSDIFPFYNFWYFSSYLKTN